MKKCILLSFFVLAVFLYFLVPAVPFNSSAVSLDTYLYNGKEFPALPDTQIENPYFVILNDYFGTKPEVLIVSSAPLYANFSSDSGALPSLCPLEEACFVEGYDYTSGGWVFLWEENLSVSVSSLSGYLWSSYDIYYHSTSPIDAGCIFMNGTTPVPVSMAPVYAVVVSSLASSAYSGSTIHFDASVKGAAVTDESVTWTVKGAVSSGTVIDELGNLSIAQDESASVLTVVATSVQDPSVYGTASISIVSVPDVKDLTIIPGKETALQGIPFVQQFTLAYKDGTAYTGPSPVWSFEVVPPDSPLPDLDGEFRWVTISDTGILSISADAPADYMVVVTAKLGDQYLTGGRVIISTETNDYLKDIINGTEEQKGQADSFGDKTDEQFADLEEDVSLIDQVTMPDIDDIDLNIDTQVSGDGMTALAMLLGLFMNSQVISTSMTFAFLFALVAFVIFGKR